MPEGKESEIIDSLGLKTHTEKAQARTIYRIIQLQKDLSNPSEPAASIVLATEDGRSLCVAPSGALSLDIADNPDLWPADKAPEFTERWNRGASSKDKVVAVYWRDHYIAQIGRLKVR